MIVVYQRSVAKKFKGIYKSGLSGTFRPGCFRIARGRSGANKKGASPKGCPDFYVKRCSITFLLLEAEDVAIRLRAVGRRVDDRTDAKSFRQRAATRATENGVLCRVELTAGKGRAIFFAVAEDHAVGGLTIAVETALLATDRRDAVGTEAAEHKGVTQVETEVIVLGGEAAVVLERIGRDAGDGLDRRGHHTEVIVCGDAAASGGLLRIQRGRDTPRVIERPLNPDDRTGVTIVVRSV